MHTPETAHLDGTRQTIAASFDATPSVETDPHKETQTIGKTFLYHMWYFALPGSSLKPGSLQAKTMLGEPILIGRDKDGKVFALRDICPHQAVPLSSGSFDGTSVKCCFHGWCFDTQGVCTDIPSLVPEQEFKVCSIKTRSYPCQEVQGSIWVYFGDKTETADLPEIPYAPGLEGFSWSRTTTTLTLPTHIDYAALALIDTAHVPYVHKSWWWRSARALKRKEKRYVPSGTGWTMVKHSPSKHSFIYQMIGDHIEDEISFRLPGCRREYLTFAGRTFLAGISALTPIDENTTELNHTTYVTVPWIGRLLRPIINYFVAEFLGQDRDIAQLQALRLKYNSQLVVTIPDAGTPGAWYFQLKNHWAKAHKESRAFVNPIKEKVLRWRT